MHLGKFGHICNKDEFFDMVNYYEERLIYAKENTSLPKLPNYHAIEEFVMDVNMTAVSI